jgi:anti-anti-sigma factor
VTSRAEIRSGICLISLDGEFDRTNVAEVRAEIDTCMPQSTSLVLDFGNVSFANGAVLSLLLETLEKLSPDGSVGIVRPLPEIERLFHVAGLTDHPNFRVYASLADALETPGRD